MRRAGHGAAEALPGDAWTGDDGRSRQGSGAVLPGPGGAAVATGQDDASSVVPLIDAWEVFPALEEAIFAAERDVMLAYWAFDQRLDLVSKQLPAELRTWEDLLRAKARQGVEVRVLLTDFDPVAAHGLHAESVDSYLRLAAIRDDLEPAARPNLQVVLSLHNARAGRLVEVAAQPVARHRLASLCRDANALAECEGEAALLRWLARSPGLWPYLRRQGGRLHPRLRFIPLHPAVHHEKSCIVDGRIAFVGGLDIGPKQYDERDHDTRIPWHDAAARLEGEAASLLGARLAQRWNRELAEFRLRREALAVPDGVPALPESGATALQAPDLSRPLAVSAHRVDLLQTHSGYRTPALHAMPQPGDRSIRTAYLDLIGSARRLLYIETQFLRSDIVVDAILRQAARAPELEVILLLPLVSDMMRDRQDPNPASRHGQWLQRRGVRRLQRALDHRFGAFTLVRNAPAPPGATPQSTAYGSDMVYVHAKVAIADDARIILGSANLNGRSLELDTEACIYWRDSDGIAQFRLRLWRHLFGGQLPDRQTSPLGLWRHLAQENAGAAPGDRQGFVVPMPDAALSWRARRHPLIPDKGV